MTRTPLIFLSLLALGCGSKDDDAEETHEHTDEHTHGDFMWPEATGDAVANYAAIVEASYTDSVNSAQALDDAIDALVASPDETTLGAARTAWLDSREPYLQTEVYRFYEGPIDNESDGPEGSINAWPMDEHTLDYVEDDATAGRINDTTFSIDADAMDAANGENGDADVTTGYHAVEFLLWGQDLSDTGPGARPATDFEDGGTADNQDRRRDYLVATSQLLVEHLTDVRDQWTPSAAYRTDFEANPEDSFAKILTGMIILSGFETGGERLQAALDSGSREDEHSCFSDNTHRDMIGDIIGIKNVWTGTYGSVSGTSIEAIVAEVDQELADEVTAQIDESLAAANALQPPFEAEIAPGSEGNARVQALITSLRAQEELLVDVFTAFGLTIDIPTE